LQCFCRRHETGKKWELIKIVTHTF